MEDNGGRFQYTGGGGLPKGGEMGYRKGRNSEQGAEWHFFPECCCHEGFVWYDPRSVSLEGLEREIEEADADN